MCNNKDNSVIAGQTYTTTFFYFEQCHGKSGRPMIKINPIILCGIKGFAITHMIEDRQKGKGPSGERRKHFLGFVKKREVLNVKPKTKKEQWLCHNAEKLERDNAGLMVIIQSKSQAMHRYVDGYIL